MARITSQITLANSGGTSAVANFTKGSYASINTQDGPNTVTIDLAGTWSQTGGLSVLFVPLQSPSVTTEPIQTISQTTLTPRNPANTSGLASAVQDTFTVGINGAGTLYVISGSATFSGPVTVTLGQSAGAPTSQLPSGGTSVPGGIPGYPSAPTETSVSCGAGALTTILAAGTYKNIVLQNNSGTVGTAGNVWVSFSGASITGGTYQNYYCLYANGGGWSENPNGVTTSAITVWNPGGSAVVVYVRAN
jgi:hypothetical protein